MSTPLPGGSDDSNLPSCKRIQVGSGQEDPLGEENGYQLQYSLFFCLFNLNIFLPENSVTEESDVAMQSITSKESDTTKQLTHTF